MTQHVCPHCGKSATLAQLQHDGRTQRWRVRVRLYRDGTEEPMADTDPELGPEKPGTEIIAGLPAVAAFVSEIAQAFHGMTLAGEELSEHTLYNKLNSLRPTLSRRGGNAVWRLQYQVTGLAAMELWRARADVERIDP